jgi:hypothetical protein
MEKCVVHIAARKLLEVDLAVLYGIDLLTGGDILSPDPVVNGAVH